MFLQHALHRVQALQDALGVVEAVHAHADAVVVRDAQAFAQFGAALPGEGGARLLQQGHSMEMG